MKGREMTQTASVKLNPCPGKEGMTQRMPKGKKIQRANKVTVADFPKKVRQRDSTNLSIGPPNPGNTASMIPIQIRTLIGFPF